MSKRKNRAKAAEAESAQAYELEGYAIKVDNRYFHASLQDEHVRYSNISFMPYSVKDSGRRISERRLFQFGDYS